MTQPVLGPRELRTAIITVICVAAITAAVGIHPSLPAYIFAMLVLVPTAARCLYGQDIPFWLVGLAWGAGIVFAVATGASSGHWAVPVRALVTGAVALIIGRYLTHFVTRTLRLSQADLAAGAGFFVGMRSWTAIILWIAVGIVLCCGLLLLLRGAAQRLRLRTPVALGVVCAAVIALIAG